MKRFVSLLLCFTMILSLAACGGGAAPASAPASSAAPAPQASSAAPAAASQGAAPAAPAQSSAAAEQTADGAGYGTLVTVRPDAGLRITGLQLAGNRSGGEETNRRGPRTEGIRFLFELNEWIEVTAPYEGTIGGEVRARILPHRPLDEYPKGGGVLDLDFAADLGWPADDGEAILAGETYVNSEDWESGDYDLLFADADGILAYTVLRLVPEDELKKMTDADLAERMGFDGAAAASEAGSAPDSQASSAASQGAESGGAPSEGQGRLQAFAETYLADGKYTLRYVLEGEEAVCAIDGENLYLRAKADGQELIMIRDAAQTTILMPESRLGIRTENGEAPMEELFEGVQPDDEYTAGEMELDGKTCYYEEFDESTEEGPSKTRYCFEGGELRYILADFGSGEETRIEVTDVSNDVDPALFTVPDGYTLM